MPGPEITHTRHRRTSSSLDLLSRGDLGEVLFFLVGCSMGLIKCTSTISRMSSTGIWHNWNPECNTNVLLEIPSVSLACAILTCTIWAWF